MHLLISCPTLPPSRITAIPSHVLRISKSLQHRKAQSDKRDPLHHFQHVAHERAASDVEDHAFRFALQRFGNPQGFDSAYRPNPGDIDTLFHQPTDQ